MQGAVVVPGKDRRRFNCGEIPRWMRTYSPGTREDSGKPTREAHRRGHGATDAAHSHSLSRSPLAASAWEAHYAAHSAGQAQSAGVLASVWFECKVCKRPGPHTRTRPSQMRGDAHLPPAPLQLNPRPQATPPLRLLHLRPRRPHAKSPPRLPRLVYHNTRSPAPTAAVAPRRARRRHVIATPFSASSCRRRAPRRVARARLPLPPRSSHRPFLSTNGADRRRHAR